MKYYEGIYQMKSKDKEGIERRVRSFRNANAIRGAIHPILVTSVGLKQNEFSGVFQGVITLKDLFEAR